MYSTSVYNYIPRQIVVLYDGSSPRRYQTVYAQNLTLNKGVDNVIQFQFLNQEQKPFDVSNIPGPITFRFISYDGTQTLLESTLVPSWTSTTTNVNINGILELRVKSIDIDNIDPQNGFYSLEIPKTVIGNISSGVPTETYNLPVFVDAMAGARGKMCIVDSVLPSFIPSLNVGVVPVGTPSPSQPVTFYSNYISSNDSSDTSFQIQLTDYQGNIQFQAATTGSDWFDIDQLTTYDTPTTITYGQTILGVLPYIRIKFADCVSGTVDEIIAR